MNSSESKPNKRLHLNNYLPLLLAGAVALYGATSAKANSDHFPSGTLKITKLDLEPETPRQALTKEVEALKNGKSVSVTKQSLELAGKGINILSGQTIQFKSDGNNYLAYFDKKAPNYRFDQTTKKIVSEMLIIPEQLQASTELPLMNAHLNEQQELVSDNESQTTIDIA